jgi:two-component system nitrate/nitrite response regulator NarL
VSLRVLIVDDSASFLDVARALLMRENVSVVELASTGVEALRRADELPLDVVLVDITLGQESGFEVARRLAERGGGAGPAVILISTHAELDFAELIAESPAIGFLAKSELSASAIRSVLDGRPPPGTPEASASRER